MKLSNYKEKLIKFKDNIIKFKDNIIKFKEEIFYLTVFLMIFRACLGDSLLLTKINEYIGSYLSVLVVILFLTVIMCEKYNKKYLFIILMLFIVFTYTSIVIKSNWLIYLLLISFALKNKKIDKVIKIFFYVKLSLLLFHFIIFSFTYVIDKDSLVVVQNVVGRPKYLMFFVSQNKIAQYYIFILLEYVYLFYEKHSKLKWFIIWGTTYIIWYICGSDILVLCVLILSLLLLFKDNKLGNIFTNLFSKYGFLSLAIITIVLIMAYNLFPELDFVYKWIDLITSGRIKLANQAINLYGFTFLGQNSQFGRFFTYNGNDIWYLFVDNAYAYFCVKIGWFYLIMISIILMRSTKFLNYTSKILICIYCIYAFSENTIIYSVSFIPLLVAIDTIINNDSYNKLSNINIW